MKKLSFSTLFLVSILMLPGCDSKRLDLDNLSCFKDTTKQALVDGRELETKEYSKTYSIGKYDKTFSVYSCENEYYYLSESSSMKHKYSGSNEYFL